MYYNIVPFALSRLSVTSLPFTRLITCLTEQLHFKDLWDVHFVDDVHVLFDTVHFRRCDYLLHQFIHYFLVIRCEALRRCYA